MRMKPAVVILGAVLVAALAFAKNVAQQEFAARRPRKGGTWKSSSSAFSKESGSTACG